MIIKSKINRTGKNNPFYGKKHSKETRIKMSIARKKRIISKETCKKISNSHKGKIFSDEHKKNISKSLLGHKRTKGYKHSLKSKLNMSKAQKGKIISEEQKKKISDTLKGRKLSEQHIENIRTATIKYRRTSIELKTEEFLLASKIKHILQKNICKHSVDFFIPKYNLCLFADGDYFHANPEFFNDDLIIRGGVLAKDRRIHDEEVNKDLIDNGFNVVRLWENEINSNNFNKLKNFIKSKK